MTKRTADQEATTMVTETDRNKARSAVVSAYHALDCVTIPFSFLHAFADAAVDAVSTDAEPFGWTSKHFNEGEEHRKWGRRRENVASYEGYIVQALYAEPVKTAPAVAVKALRDTLEWYGEQARLAKLIHSEGDPGRWALAEDGGKRANAALSAQVQDLAGWQPIETAPRDGSEFQAWIKDYGWEPKARINLSTEAFEIWGRVDYDEEGWSVYPHMIPSHWMPLPASPAYKHGDAE